MFTYYCKHESILSVAFSPDGSKLLTAGADSRAKLWDIATSRLLLTFVGHEDFVLSARFSPDGSRIATCGADKSVKLWDAGTANIIHTFSGYPETVWSAEFSPDGSRLLTASDDGTARLLDLDTPDVSPKVLECDSAARHAVYSRDGSLIAASTDRGTIELWDAASLERRMVRRGHDNVISCIAFSPDRKRLLIAAGRRAKMLSLEPEGDVQEYARHHSSITSASFSPRGRLVLTSSLDSTAVLWYSDSGRVLATYPYPEAWANSYLNCSAFSPSSPRIATAGGDDIAIVWDISPYVDSDG